ncbi:MAG: arylsulfotransferase family protein [Acidobacteriota bacterium]|nr:arylsulfotransferase family protein [Acidobacteriota bacterium]
MTTTSRERPGVTRRQFIPRAAGLLAALGLGGAGGYELRGAKRSPAVEPEGFTATTIPAAGEPGSGVSSFVTRPDLRPAAVRITELVAHGEKHEPRFIVMAPMADIAYESDQRGPMIVDRRGRLIWFERSADSTFNVQVQMYKGQRVLTRWHGQLLDGYGAGVGELIDQTYTTIATVGDARSRPIDLHELQLTSRGTALVTHYETRPYDLSSIGGAGNGTLLVSHALEIDVATNETLLDWASIDHVGLDESYQPLPSAAGDAFNYFHVNSVAEAHDGNLLISGRNTWCVYKVHRRSGEVMWRLNGKRSDFRLPDAAGFSWQHHVRAHGTSELTLFDNANISGHESRALLLELDEGRKRVSLERVYRHPAKFVAWTLGSVEVRPDGNVFVGWGAQPYFSEFSADGGLLVDGQFESATRSYRTFLSEWSGRPTGKPTMAARSNGNSGFVIYASWNGATEIDHWTVLAGADQAALQPVGAQPWTGFETTIVVNSEGPFFQVAAIDRHGNELGRSDPT